MLKKTFLGVLFAVFVSALLIAGVNFNVTKAVNYSSSGTLVGGIIWENTTWTLENSPYIITDTVQIPEDVTLTLEPGVAVSRTNSTYGVMFLIHGKVSAQGTSNNRIAFDGGNNSLFFSVKNSNGNALLDLDYCIIKNGMAFWASAGGRGHFILRHSEVVNLLRDGLSIVNDFENDIIIEYNRFINVNTFVFEINSISYNANVIVRNNVFKGNVVPVIRTYIYLEEKMEVRYNSFINNTGIVLGLSGGVFPFYAKENYWGTLNNTIIDSMIYDKKDDITCPGVIEYLPILMEPHPDTPTLPITVNFTYSPSTVYAHGAVTFDASASFGLYSSIANYTWDFGDGNITTTLFPIVSHTYTIPGSYNVTLTATDEFGFQNSTVTSITVLEDDAPPMIGIPSRIPEGDVEPYQEVRILVNVTDLESGIKNVTLSCLNIDKPVSNFSIVKDLNITLCLHRPTYYYKDAVSGDVTITYPNGTAFIGKFSIYVKAQFGGYGMSTYPGYNIDGFTKFYLSPPLFLYGPGNYTIGIDSLYTADGYIIENRWAVFPSVQVEAKDDSIIWIDLPMTFNSTTGLYEATIPGQGEDILVRYKITAYDNAGNYRVEDKDGEYYVYTVIPEFPYTMILPLFTLTTLIAIVLLKKKRKTKPQLP